MASEIEHCAGLVRAGDPLRYLATLYAPTSKRPALFAIHALDLVLLGVATSTTDAMIGQIRLAWWRERITELGQGRAPAEPVLAALANAGVTAASLHGFDDPSLALIDEAPVQWAELRGERLFAAISAALGVPATPDTLAAGRGWATVDGWRRGYLHQDEAAKLLAAAPRKSPVPLRPLLGLLAVARRDLRRADPGQPDGVTISPSRQIRLAFAIVTGRL